MARIQSPTWAMIRGSVGGTNYLSGPQHQIVARSRISPIRPTSSDSTCYRTCFAQAALKWRLLSVALQTDWAHFASTLWYLDPTGQYTITGRNAFLAYYALHLYMRTIWGQGAMPITFPSKFDGWLPLIVFPGIKASPPLGELAINIINASPNEHILIYLQISKAYDGTRTFFKGPWTTRGAIFKFVFWGQSTFVLFTGLRTYKYYFVRARAITFGATGARYSKPHIIRSQAA